MGLCGSSMTADDKRSKEVEARNKADFEAEQSKIKLLLLGAGESGKSTIFKQMKILYGLGFSPEEQKQMTPVVYNNTIVSMKTLLQAAEDLTPPVAITAAETAKRVMEVSDDREIDAEVGGWIKELWADPGVTETYEQRSKFQLIDSAEYYFESIDRIMADDYTATVTDILKSRVRTSGIVEEKYKIDGVDFVMFDVGGQRNERKKWIHCFDDVTAVIFVAAISEYDQVLYEDNRQNRMDEAITLFDEICNSRWFEDTSMILFLNKKDLFEKKIKKISIRQPATDELPGRFEDFEGGICTCGGGYPSDFECTCGVQDAGKQYMLDKFLEKNSNEVKEIYYHITCATDTSNIKHVFDACKDIILKNNLKGSGFME